MIKLFNHCTELRTLSVGDNLVELLPGVGLLFQAKYARPYKFCIVAQMAGTQPDQRKKSLVCDINILKPYYSHNREMQALPPARPG